MQCGDMATHQREREVLRRVFPSVGVSSTMDTAGACPACLWTLSPPKWAQRTERARVPPLGSDPCSALTDSITASFLVRTHRRCSHTHNPRQQTAAAMTQAHRHHSIATKTALLPSFGGKPCVVVVVVVVSRVLSKGVLCSHACP